MARVVIPALGLALLLLLLPGVPAGAPDAPEVPDPSGDAAVCIEAPACTPTQDSLDVLAAWVDAPDDASVAFHMNIGAAPTVVGVGAGTTVPGDAPAAAGVCLQAATYFGFNVHFQTMRPDGSLLVPALPGTTDHLITDQYVSAALVCDTVAGGPESVNALGFYLIETDDGGPDATNGHISSSPVQGSISGTTITWTVPRSDPLLMLPNGTAAGGYLIGNLWAESFVGRSAVALVFDPVAIDRAPDADFGRSFAFPATPVAGPSYSEVTTATFSLQAQTAEPSRRVEVYNWTNADTSLDLAYAVASSAGSVHLLVTDSSGAAVLDQTITGNVQDAIALPDAKTGAWQVRVAYLDFVGDVQLGIAKAVAQAPPPAAPAEPVIDGSANDQATGGFPLREEEKDTPMVGPLATTIALLAVALAMRRRIA